MKLVLVNIITNIMYSQKVLKYSLVSRVIDSIRVGVGLFI